MIKSHLEKQLENYHNLKIETQDEIIRETCTAIINNHQEEYKELTGAFYVMRCKR